MNEPAFPQGHMDGPHINPSGITKLEYFTAAAMQGMLSNSALVSGLTDATDEKYSDMLRVAAVCFAKRTISELSKEVGK